jgi:hypothetical protein
MPLSTTLAGAAWLAANAPGYRAFRAALDDPRTIQKQVLLSYLHRNADTAFGRLHGFSEIRTVEELQERVPLATYADFEPWIDRIAAGEKRVLTSSPVKALEVTSGSSSAAKRIPYTADLQREIRRAVAPWIFDLYRDRPRLAPGCAYWSITPLALEEEERPPAAVRVGFEEDGEYLGGFWKRLADATLAVPGAVRLVRDIESFRYVTLLCLLRRRDLSLISVWHPSFLRLLMKALPEHWASLQRDIARGTLTPPTPLPPPVRDALLLRLMPRPHRAAELRWRRPDDLPRIWPNLRLISCWGDAHAALHLEELRRAFPGVEIQRKGLLATEAFVTLPFEGKTPLAVRSHFFEFIPEGSRGDRPRLAHQLEPGGVYSVVVTTGGGLYRYLLEDRVEVDGFVDRTPSLRFLGKEGHVSDLHGEKLHESFVAGALARTFARLGLAPRFALLAPESAHYTLYLEREEKLAPGVAEALEEELAANPHYRACVALGQLGPVKVFRVDGDAFLLYLRRCREGGQRLGDVKPLALSPLSGWSELFPGDYCGEHSGGPI